jgi:16S rRNA (guanine966-N2)-methyltransferase
LVRWRALLSKQSTLGPFDTIFCDPPYRKKLIDKAFRLLDDDSLWTEDAIWVAEMAPEEEITQNKWQKIKEKIHGDSKVVIFKRLK